MIERLDHGKVGIATSVAKEYGFSWQKTIEWALSEKLEHIQFFINPQTLKQDLIFYLKYAQGLQAYFHLPSQAGEATVHYCLHTLRSLLGKAPIVLVQHQQWAQTVQRFLPFYSEMILAVENDSPETEPHAFMDFLQTQVLPHQNWAVLDIPRFYFQAPGRISSRDITAQIDLLIEFLGKHSVPFLIHAIDQTDRGGDRSHWKPFLQGDLPWLHFIGKIKNVCSELKCLLFEYENWDMAKEGIERITNRDSL